MIIDSQKIQKVIDNSPQDKKQLIMILQNIQKQFHYLPKESIGLVSEYLGMPQSTVYSAATFYKSFSLVQRGENIIKVCKGTACHIKGADLIAASNIGLIPLLIMFILLSASINMLMGSASAKWALLAPVFIPMFMFLGYSPELSQVVFRIGDSVTNIISPMMSFFALIIAFIQKYDPKAGIGTIISTMLPYSIAFFIIWTILLIVWVLLGLPLGPGASLYYNVG